MPRFLLLFALGLSACAHTSSVDLARQRVAPATDTPAHFLVGSHTGPETSAPRAGEGCRNPLVDGRDGARLVLVRSGDGVGDYEVPAGRYGVGERELLRVDCATGRALGRVRR